jgi:hypothetical protein
VKRSYLKLRRPNARAKPIPTDDLEPDERKVWKGRRKQEATPATISEQPLEHFSKDEVESRVQAFINRPREEAKNRRTVKCDG